MSGDPLTLVRFICVATGHAHVKGAGTLTIHERAWAFCSAGGTAAGHIWKSVDGLPLAIAMSSTAVAHDGSSQTGAERDPQTDQLDRRPTSRKVGAVGR